MASGYSNPSDHGYPDSNRDQHFISRRNRSRYSMEDESEITSQQGPYLHHRRHRGLMYYDKR